MEREEFKTIVKGLKAVYAQPAFIPDADAFDVWYGMLRDLPYRQASLAVQQHMASSPYPPNHIRHPQVVCRGDRGTEHGRCLGNGAKGHTNLWVHA